MPGARVEQLLQAAFAVRLGYVGPAEVAEAAAELDADGQRSIAQQLELAGHLNVEQRKHIEHQVARTLFAGRETLELPAEELDSQEADHAPGALMAAATLDFDDSQVSDAARKFGPERPGLAPDGQMGLLCAAQPGRYSIRKLHSRGGQARILLAFDEVMGREVAVKELVPKAAKPGEDEEVTTRKRANQVERFLREARITAQLDHPNITPVHELGRLEDGSLYYTMRFVHGQTLGARLLASESLDERLKLLGAFWDVCNAIAFAHDRGVIHRDIKPENVMAGEHGQTVVVDWGIAKVRGMRDERARDIERRLEQLQADTGATMAGWAIGTPAYMSPEQARGEVERIDERSDVYGLGAVLYEILTGAPPYTGASGKEIILKVANTDPPPVTQVCPEAPAELVAICNKALSRDPAARYENARQVADDMSAYMTGSRVRAYEYSSWELLRRFAARNKVAISAAGLILLTIVAALVMVIHAWGQASLARDRERGERLVANLHLAQGYAEKADRLADQGAHLAARVFAAASLAHNPANPQGPFHAAGFAGQHPASRDLLVVAASRVYRARHSMQARVSGILPADGTANRLTVSADGKAMAAVTQEGVLLVWERSGDGGWTRREVKLVDGRAYGVAFDHHGRIITAASDGLIRIHAREDLKVVGALSGHRDEVLALALSPDGRTLASGGMDKTVRLWDLDQMAGLRVLKGHTGRLWCLAFSPDGRLLASGAWDKTVRVWRVADGAVAETFSGHDDAVYGLAFSPDGGELASVSWDKTLRIWDPVTGRVRLVLEDARDALLDVAWSPDGRTLAAGSADRNLRIWDAKSGELQLAIEGHADVVSAVNFLPGEAGAPNLVASAGFDRQVRLWRLDPSARIPRLSGHDDWVYGVAYSPDGSRLATASWDKTGAIFDLATGRMLHRLTGPQGHTAGLYAVAYSPDGRTVATTDSLGGLRLWDAESGALRHAIQAHDKWIYGLAFSPDGKLLATCARDQRTRLWNPQTGELVRTITGHPAWLYRLAISSDGELVATGGTDHKIQLFKTADGEPAGVLTGHTDWVSGLDFSSTDRLLASSGRDGQVIIWDLEAMQEIRRLKFHKQWVNVVRFSPDDSLLASASDDSSVVVWSALTGRPLLHLKFGAGIVGLDFSPDGKTLAVGDGKTVALFPLDFTALKADPTELLELAEKRLGRRLDGFELVSRQAR